MDRCRIIQHIFLRTRRRVLLRCGQSAWVGYQRPKCMWLALLAIQLWFAEHKQYGVLTIPIAGTVGKADGKFWDYDDGVQNYLMQFGYLEKSNIETGNLRTINELEQAVRKLQSYGNIKPTGKVDAATLELMRRPRCGSPDFRDSLDFLANNDERLESRRRTRRYVKQGQKWHNPIVTWSLVNQTMGLLDAGQVRRILYEALDLWSRHANISFRETYSTEADIQVMFARKFHGDGYNFDGPGKILAHAFYPGTGIGGDAHFDEEESWLLNEPLEAEGTRLFDVALHEFGHSLGLGHSSQQNAIMFPWHHISYRGKDTIPEDDRLGIESIYGPRTKRYGPNPERHTPRTSTTTTTVAPTPPPRPTTKPHYPSKGVPGHPREGYPNRVPSYPRTTITTTTSTTEMPRSREYFPSYGNRHPVRHHTTTTTTQVVPTATTHHRQHHHPHHRPVAPPTRRTHPGGPTPPNACNTSFDAITMIRNELFVFKDRWLWRMEQLKTSDGVVEAHRPPVAYEINRLFFGLPDDFERIDTVYENKYQKIIFFIGKQYFVFNSQNIEPGYPRPLTDLGLPESIERIDAALVWSHNNRTYLYSGRLYWRFDEDTNKVELDYPRDMSIWKGIGYNIDAAFQYSDGKTYFFKGLGYWRFNDMRMRVSHDQQPSATRWMRCPNERQVQNDLDDPSGADPTDDLPDRDLHPRIDTSRGASRWTSCHHNLALLLLSLSLIALHH